MGSTGRGIGMRELRGDELPPIKVSEVSVNDDFYRTTVGRPSGMGNWAFFPDRGRNDIDNAIFVNGSYAEAKKKARREAARRGWRTIYTGT